MARMVARIISRSRQTMTTRQDPTRTAQARKAAIEKRQAVRFFRQIKGA
jgi:hypothetical protein